VRRVAVIASCPGNGKTTIARALAQGLDVPLVELDALVFGPGWTETPDEELRAAVGDLVAADGWVVDGFYGRKLGDLVLRSADVVVWLDLPVRIWLPRLARRTARRLRTGEELWNGNREVFLGGVVGRDSVLLRALRLHVRRRRDWPTRLAGYPVVRLRTASAVDAFLADICGESAATDRHGVPS
jgi:adenylate kinase family enzyme